MKHRPYSPSRRNFLHSTIALGGGLSILPSAAPAEKELAIIPKIEKG